MFTEQTVILRNSEFLAFAYKIDGIYVIYIQNNYFYVNYVNGVYSTYECQKFSVFLE